MTLKTNNTTCNIYMQIYHNKLLCPTIRKKYTKLVVKSSLLTIPCLFQRVYKRITKQQIQYQYTLYIVALQNRTNLYLQYNRQIFTSSNLYRSMENTKVLGQKISLILIHYVHCIFTKYGNTSSMYNSNTKIFTSRTYHTYPLQSALYQPKMNKNMSNLTLNLPYKDRYLQNAFICTLIRQAKFQHKIYIFIYCTQHLQSICQTSTVLTVKDSALARQGDPNVLQVPLFPFINSSSIHIAK
eukprot:TRINITY_DN2491_c0_g1_i12.p2 TRINITY_DN2491_c0_g1~~TRINITY_DN2491_c0_g1_i12.p2  ORF type:complete len:241 (+),score=-33.72 TRINITY_DN2491_c0_g1_i12:134-856(+)